MERIQSTRFSFRRKGSKNKEKEARERDATIDFDYDTLSFLRSASVHESLLTRCLSKLSKDERQHIISVCVISETFME